MSKYFISLVERDLWRIGPRELVEALKRQWPAVRIVSDLPTDYQLVSFELDLEHATADVYLQAGGDCVVIDGDLDDVASFALWMRALVPENVPLLLWDEGYNSHIPVTPSSRVEELTAAFCSEEQP